MGDYAARCTCSDAQVAGRIRETSCVMHGPWRDDEAAEIWRRLTKPQRAALRWDTEGSWNAPSYRGCAGTFRVLRRLKLFDSDYMVTELGRRVRAYGRSSEAVVVAERCEHCGARGRHMDEVCKMAIDDGYAGSEDRDVEARNYDKNESVVSTAMILMTWSQRMNLCWQPYDHDWMHGWALCECPRHRIMRALMGTARCITEGKAGT